MAESKPTSKPKLLNRHYLLDRPAQLSFSVAVLAVMAGIGLLHAFAVHYLLGTDLLRGKSLAEMRTILFLIQCGYFLVGGAIVFVTIVLLSHRFVGPAFVIRRALAKMRRGDFTARLTLRRRDCHKSLAEECRLLRDELAEQDEGRMAAYERLERALEDGDTVHARFILTQLRQGPPAETEAAA